MKREKRLKMSSNVVQTPVCTETEKETEDEAVADGGEQGAQLSSTAWLAQLVECRTE